MKTSISRKTSNRLMAMAFITSSTMAFSTPEADPSGPTEVAGFIQMDVASDSRMAGTSVSVTIENGIAVLKGKVSSIDQAERAAERALAAVEVRAVVNEIEVSSAVISDSNLKAAVQKALQRNIAIDSKRVIVKAAAGKVTLSGEVGTWDEQEMAREVTSTVAGVAAIENKTQIVFDSVRTDRQIEDQLRQMIANDPLCDGLTLSATVKEGVVRLKGHVGSKDEYDRLVRRSSVTGVFEVNADRLAINSELKMEGVGDKNFSAEQIMAALGDSLKMDERLDAQLIDFKFGEGVIILNGQVFTATAKAAAESDARGIPGVIAVNNQLRIAESRGPIVANAPLVKPR